MIGRVDHQGNFDLLHLDLEEARQVVDFVAVRILKVDVDDLRAAAHLRAADLGCFLEFALRDQPLEFAAAEHVGALADDHRARALVDDQRFDSRRPPSAPGGDATRGLRPATICASRRICSGVVPQHPPTTLSHP